MSLIRNISLAIAVTLGITGCGTLTVGEPDQSITGISNNSASYVNPEKGRTRFNNEELSVDSVLNTVHITDAGTQKDSGVYIGDGGIERDAGNQICTENSTMRADCASGLDGYVELICANNTWSIKSYNCMDTNARADAGDPACYTNSLFNEIDLANLVIERGTWNINNEGYNRNYLEQTDVGEGWQIAYIPMRTYNNFETSIKLRLPRFTGTDHHVSLLLRYSPQIEEGYVIGIENYENIMRLTLENLTHRIIQRVITASDDGRWHELRVLAIGNQILGYFDEVEVIRSSSSLYRSGNVGIGTYHSQGHFKDLTICMIGSQ